MERIAVEEIEGHLLVVKRARDRHRRASLAAEAAWLERLQQPGVVEFSSFHQTDGYDELRTVHAGSATLADYRPPNLGALAATLASTAMALADMHSAGVCHGGVLPDHVIVGAGRHVVLCSLGAATPISPDARAADLDALASTIESLVALVEPSPGLAGRRQRRGLHLAVRSAREPGADAFSLARILADLPDASPEPRVAVESGEAISHRTLPSRDGETRPETDNPADTSGTRTWRDRVPPEPSSSLQSPRTQPKLSAVAVLAVLGALVGTAAFLATRSGGAWSTDAMESNEPRPTSLEGAQQRAEPSLGVESRCGARPLCIQPCPPGHLDIDGDGCDDDVSVAGHFIRAGDQLFAAGHPGDVVVVGDWDCDGSSTPALLRSSSGDVFFFDQWSAADSPVEVFASATVPGAVGLDVARTSECDVLTFKDAHGRVLDPPVGLP